MAAFHSSTAATASAGEMPVVHPVASENAAAAVIAHSTTRARPWRWAVSLPVTDTAMPASPATVNRTAGEGIHAGVPSRAAEAARTVTAQARRAASSQVWTV